jgi:hypothetical protein
MNSNAELLYAGNQALSSLVSITWKEIWYLVRTLQLIEKLKTLDVTTKSIEKLKTLDVTTKSIEKLKTLDVTTNGSS